MRAEYRDKLIYKYGFVPLENIVIAEINDQITRNDSVSSLHACCMLAEIGRLKEELRITKIDLETAISCFK